MPNALTLSLFMISLLITTAHANERDGPYQQKNSQGQVIREGNFAEGKMTGLWKRYYPNGNLKDEGSWANEAPEGHWRFYREDESLEEEGFYENGEPVCTWKKTSPNGEVNRIEKQKPKKENCDTILPWSFQPSWRESRPSHSLGRFSLDGILAYQDSHGRSRTFMAGYHPQWKLGRSWDFVTGFGVSAFNSRSGDLSFIPVVDFSGGIRYYFSNVFYGEFRVALQTWIRVGSFFAPSLKVGFDPKWKDLLFYLGIQPTFIPENSTDEIHLGVEFNWAKIFGGSK